MKRFIATVIIALMLVQAFDMTEPYLMKGFVSSVDPAGRFEVVNYACSHVPYGNAWGFEDAEDLFVGDVVVLLMNDNGTEEFSDDVCIDMMYTGVNRYE